MSNLGLKTIERALHSPGIHYRNPFIPSVVHIPGGLAEGSKIYIGGCVAKKAKRFSVNLQRTEAEGSDIYFHLDVRFDDGPAIVRNTCFAGVWGEEERDSPLFPFEPSIAFIMCITVSIEKFTVEIDGNELVSFANRADSISNINYFSVFGSVYISEFNLPFIDSKSRRDFIISVPANARIGDQLMITGKTPSNPDKFAINLTTGPNPSDNIAMHLNARFKGDDMLVLNSKSEDLWGDEIRVNDTDDFKVSKHLNNVKLLISVEGDGLKAYINKFAIDPFPHRIGLNSIKYVAIDGDLLISDVYYLSFPVKNDKYKVKVIKSGIITMPINIEIIPCKSVVVSGLVEASAKRFYVNLQLNNDDIAMHFNPRWDDARCEGECLVVNSKTNGEWGTEIREPLQLKPNMYYEMIFKFENQNEIDISIDGCGINRAKVARLSHAFNNSDIKFIEVGGSFVAQQIACVY